MKFVLYSGKNMESWNGKTPLPNEINVISNDQQKAELDLLGIICALHSHVTAFDLLTGADEGSEKDTDINAVMTAFHAYLYPKMPLSNYNGDEKRIKSISYKQTPIKM